MRSVEASRDQRLFEFIDQRLLAHRSLTKAFKDGFRESVHSCYDEDEERFPGSERSMRLESERNAFCAAFEQYVEGRVAELAAFLKERVLDGIVRHGDEPKLLEHCTNQNQAFQNFSLVNQQRQQQERLPSIDR
jgi:hypothetical protein